MGFKVTEDLVKSLVSALLVLQLPILDGCHAIQEGGIVCDELSHLDEGPHDAHAHLDGLGAVEEPGQHCNPLLRVGVWHVASSAVTSLIVT